MISLILPLAKINICQAVRQQYPTTWSNWLKLASQPLLPLVCQSWWWAPTMQGLFRVLFPHEQCFALPGAERSRMAWQLLSLCVPAQAVPRNAEICDLGRAGSPHRPPQLPRESQNCSQSPFRSLRPFQPHGNSSPWQGETGMAHTPKATH